MSNRKVHSQGNVPFSWESRPGISKFSPKDCPVEETPLSVDDDDDSPESPVRDPRIPLPPGMLQPLRMSASFRARFRQGQDDPFLAAYRECTRSGRNVEEVLQKVRYRENRDKGIGGKKGLVKRKGLSMFSCKSSCEVREDTIMRISDVDFS